MFRKLKQKTFTEKKKKYCLKQNKKPKLNKKISLGRSRKSNKFLKSYTRIILKLVLTNIWQFYNILKQLTNY